MEYGKTQVLPKGGTGFNVKDRRKVFLGGKVTVTGENHFGFLDTNFLARVDTKILQSSLID